MEEFDYSYKIRKNSMKTSKQPIPEHPNMYMVEKILSKRIVDKNIEYLVKWQGFENDESTWEHIRNLCGVAHLIEIFEKKNENEKNKKNENLVEKTKEKQRNGNFEQGDEVEEIIGICPKNNQIMALVKWKMDKNGVRPHDSLVSTKKFKENEESAFLLINFYEKKLNI